jgi:hypothetical protein
MRNDVRQVIGTGCRESETLTDRSPPSSVVLLVRVVAFG